MNFTSLHRRCLFVLLELLVIWSELLSAAHAGLGNAAIEKTEFEQYAMNAIAASNLDSAELCGIDSPLTLIRIVKPEAYSKPCCVSPVEDEIECFVLGPKGNTKHASITIGATEWEDLGGQAWNEPVCVTNGVEETYDVITTGIDLVVYKRSHTKVGWDSGPKRPTGLFVDVPCCVYTSTTKFECLNRGLNNRMFSIASVDGEWQHHKYIHASEYVSSVACVSTAQGSYDGFVLDREGKATVSQFKGSNGSFSGPQNRGGTVKGTPTVTGKSERMDVFALGVENGVVHLTWTKANGWGDWKDLGGTWGADPICISRPKPYSIWCFAISTSSELHTNSFNGQDWTGWKTHCLTSIYKFLEAPSCVFSKKNEVSCFGRDATRKLIQMTFKA